MRATFVVVERHSSGERAYTPIGVTLDGGALHVTIADRSHRITLEGRSSDIVAHGDFDGVPYCAQIERIGLEWRVSHDGATVFYQVLSPRAAELLALMPVKAPPDLSKFLLAPMPGLLVEIAVRPGEAIRAGGKLAVIEAMKMENLLVASHDGVVAEITAKQGETLSVDQVIMRFA